MKAVVLNEARAPELREIAEPEPAAGQVLLEVDHCGICGSDLHAAAIDTFRPGVVMGHEFSATIAELGPDVDGWRVGERVCVNPNGVYCGRCEFCRHGDVNLCPCIQENSIGVCSPGAMAALAAVDAAALHRIPDSMPGARGAWVEPTAVALRAVRRSGIRIGEDAVVFGAGPIGLLVTALLRGAGAGTVTVVEPSAPRREMAGIAGADRTLDPAAEDVRSTGAPSFAFDCVGASAVADTAIGILRPHGRLTLVGIPPDKLAFTGADAVFKEIDIRGSFIYTDEFSDAIGLLDRGIPAVERFTSDVRPLTEALGAFDELREGRGVKILLQP